jgi:hypothetical protein
MMDSQTLTALKQFEEATERHGDTPIIVRSGSGNSQAWYRNNGEGRWVRPQPSIPIDVLGDGYVVAPPSKGVIGPYEFLRGSLDDLRDLPPMMGLEGLQKTRKAATQLPPGGIAGAAANGLRTRPWGTETSVPVGRRNNELFRRCLGAARRCDDLDQLLDWARSQNDFPVPLPDDEVAEIGTHHHIAGPYLAAYAKPRRWGFRRATAG